MNGILLVDKSMGWKSHDIVAKLRYRLGIRKIGHAGTLAPMATGLLILLVGNATKVS
jgi:tRNA pseudouridine55 synthase